MAPDETAVLMNFVSSILWICALCHYTDFTVWLEIYIRFDYITRNDPIRAPKCLISRTPCIITACLTLTRDNLISLSNQVEYFRVITSQLTWPPSWYAGPKALLFDSIFTITSISTFIANVYFAQIRVLILNRSNALGLWFSKSEISTFDGWFCETWHGIEGRGNMSNFQSFG